MAAQAVSASADTENAMFQYAALAHPDVAVLGLGPLSGSTDINFGKPWCQEPSTRIIGTRRDARRMDATQEFGYIT